jgi:hypothetical protein
LFVPVLIALLLLSPVQVATPKIQVWITFVPILYDTIFPVVISIKVVNSGNMTFEGGTLTSIIEPPSKRYTLTLIDTIPELGPSASHTVNDVVWLQAGEGGVYTVTTLFIDTIHHGRIMMENLYGTGFAAQNLLGPEWFIGTMISIIGIVVAVRAVRTKERKKRKASTQRLPLRHKEITSSFRVWFEQSFCPEDVICLREKKIIPILIAPNG